MKKIDWLVFFFIIIISVFALKDLLKPDFYTSHDGIHQIARFYYFDQALHDGQIPPRWAGGLLNGFGYPLFIFSYHLPWFIAEIFHFLGSSIIGSIKLTFLAGFILSGLFMYLFQKEVFGRIPALGGTVLYLFAPYRFSNIFVRAAIGDATIFIFPPLLFLSLYKLKQKDKIDWSWVVLGAVALAGMMLSHVMVFFFFALAFGLYSLFFLLWIKKRKNFFKSVIIIALLALGFSSYYFFPSLFERNLTRFSEIMGGVFIGNTFLNFKELLYSPWGYGTMHSYEGGMSFQIGIAQWLAVILAFLLLIYSLRKKAGKTKENLQKEAVFYLILFFLSLLAMFPVSLPFWKNLSKFIIIDFPWRILALSVFSASILAGFVLSKVKFSWIFTFLFILLAFYANRNHLRINQVLDWPLSFCLKLEKTTNSYDEYTPKWVKNELVEKVKPKVYFSEDTALINVHKLTSNNLDFSLSSPVAGKVRINTIYYPGWQVWVNNRLVPIDYQSSGLIEFPLEAGNSQVTVKFRETSSRLASDILTIMTIGLGAYLLIKSKIDEKNISCHSHI